MNRYEIALVLNALIEDSARAAIVDRVKDYVARFGGNVTDVDEWGKRRLAYEIQKMKEGYYYFIHFEAEPTVPGQLEPALRIMDNVLRYLIVSQDEETAARSSALAEEHAKAKANAPAEAAPVEAAAEEAPAEATAEEAPVEAAPAEATEEAPAAEETPAEEAPVEESAEEPAESSDTSDESTSEV